MPALKATAGLWNHLFLPEKPNETGFHSKAKWDKIKDKPNIHRTLIPNPAGLGCYMIGWRFGGLTQQENDSGIVTALKWSTMFPDTWDESKVKQAVNDAITYWNNAMGENKARLESLIDKYHLKWIGNAKVGGKTLVIGGLGGGDEARTAYPLHGANMNFPQIQGVALYRGGG
ncbi:MAG TPA: EndoU domain-containing protein [Terracidiphilus sp.]|nr:EndoU domain-containing protein [Terracidiphilus sp.]